MEQCRAPGVGEPGKLGREPIRTRIGTIHSLRLPRQQKILGPSIRIGGVYWIGLVLRDDLVEGLNSGPHG